MSEENLQDDGFIKFCDLVKTTLGESSTEVLYAWYYDTFNLKETKTVQPTNKKDESTKSK
jgi:hypothetical protein